MSTGGSSVTMREMRRSWSSGLTAQVGHLAVADDLHAIRVDVVEVAHQVGGRLRVAHGGVVETALGVGVSGDPFPVQHLALRLEQRLGTDDVGFMRCRAVLGRPAARAQARRFRGLPVGDQLVHWPRIGLGLQPFAQLAVGQHLGDLRKDLQVALRCGLGHQQEDQQADRLVIGGIECDRLLHAQHRGQRVLQALDAAMRNGHAMAEAGGAQAFAGKQVVGDGARARSSAGSRTAARRARKRASCWWHPHSPAHCWAAGWQRDDSSVDDPTRRADGLRPTARVCPRKMNYRNGPSHGHGDPESTAIAPGCCGAATATVDPRAARRGKRPEGPLSATEAVTAVGASSRLAAGWW